VVSVAAGFAPTTRAQQQPPQQQQSPPPPQQAQQPQPASSAPAGAVSPGTDLFSVDRIRKQLDRPPAFTFTMPDPKLPVYRLRVEGFRFKLPTWQQNFLPPQSSWVRQPFGGADYYEMQRLITPPQAWGSAPFSNGEVLGMLVSQATSSLAVDLIKKGLDARRNGVVTRARQEVQQELADIAAHNAQVTAGQAADGSDATKAAEKKKQEQAKKKKKATGEK